MKKGSAKTVTYSVDRMMSMVALSLIRDFQDGLSDPGFCSDLQSAVKAGDIAGIRNSCPAPDQQMDVATYKATYQMQSLFKRYRFETDLYSDSELEAKALQGFFDTQSRIASISFDKLSAFSQLVLRGAAIYISDLLGVYDDEEHRSLCRFGKKASVGVPARAACEAARWELPISGSPEQIAWFDEEMSQIQCVQEYWAAQKGSDPKRSTYQVTSSLKLALVPKSFKSLRAIVPNTTIGSYMSYGLGEMLRKRLKRKGYDIRTLQQRHRYLAGLASEHNMLVTADLSSASDSISVALVEKLFPPDWFEILNRSRIGTVTLPGNLSVETETFCTMGIGYTFPLQTIVFLALLKSIEAILFNRLDRRTISVYGDDMIYASRMHRAVVHVFKQIGFVINLDKTYHDGHFRESCGGDYYRGVDVRPFQPQNGSANVGPKTYEAVLYKYINCLLVRWSEYEIERTLNFLCSEVELLVGKCKLVPGDYPDDAGIKCPTLTAWSFLRRTKCCTPKHLGSGVYRFPYLRFTPDEREEVRHVPYLWGALRGRDLPVYDYAGGCRLQGPASILAKLINDLVGVQEATSDLILRDLKPIKTFRSEISGRRLRRQSTFVAVSHTGRYTRQSGTSGFEFRR